MNAYTFVTKQIKQPEHEMKIGSSILQRLQQLKKSMKPSQPLQQQYESTTTNKNFGINLSNIQNQRLNKYLPNQQESKLKAQNEEGTQQFQSYRKSLQKKLNYLFDKQKQIMRTQSTYQPTKYPILMNQQVKFSEISKHDEDDLQRKYHQFNNGSQMKKYEDKQRSNMFVINRETKSFSNLNKHHNVNEMQREPYQNRQNKAFSTMEHVNFMKSQNTRQRKDQQIDQMQRKIKILEMKYLGNNTVQSQVQRPLQNHNLKRQNHGYENQIIRQNRSKSTKSRQNKQRTSPDNIKTKNKNMNKQTIDSNYLYQDKRQQSKRNLNVKQSIKKQQKVLQNHQTKVKRQKHRVKDYMKTIDKCQQQTLNQKQYLLHQQFNSLKYQFQTLLEINKTIIEKVETNQEQKFRKKQNKLRAKAMLKQILYRLEEIKYQIKSQSSNKEKHNDGEEKIGERIKADSLRKRIFDQTKPNTKKQLKLFQKSSNWNEPNKKSSADSHIQAQKLKKSSEKKMQQKSSPLINIQKNQKTFDDDVDKLKHLLNLQIQHRNIVEKKLEVVMYGHNKATIQ